MVSSPKVPEVKYPDPPPPVPERSVVETQTMAEAQRRRYYGQGGRNSTMLTGGQGAGSSAISFLGGASKT